MTLEKMLWLASVLSAGCGLTSVDERADDSRSGFHDVTVRWHIRNVDGTVMRSCPAGYTTLVTHLYSVGFMEPPDALVTTPCTPEGSLTRPVATAGDLKADETCDQSVTVCGFYPYSPTKDIWMDITEETQSVYAAKSFYYHVEALASSTTIDFDIYPDGGVAVAAWSLTSSLTSARLTSCATARVDEIEYAVRPYGDDTAPLVVGGRWPCTQVDPYFYYDPDGNSTLFDPDEYELGTGHTRGYLPGDYYVELRAKRAGVIVGRGEGSFVGRGENEAHRINGTEIPIDNQ